MNDINRWLNAWQHGRTGFHLSDVNPFLKEFMPPAPQDDARPHVLVPLCGKSLDMIWLASQGYEVIGIEASEIAVKAFFEENQLKHTVETKGEHVFYRTTHITIVLGDFFTVNPADLASCDFYYDRAALIALPSSLRTTYVEQVQRLLTPTALGLLISMTYNHTDDIGPPFSISESDVINLYQSADVIKLLEEKVHTLPESLKAADIDSAIENIYDIRFFS